MTVLRTPNLVKATALVVAVSVLPAVTPLAAQTADAAGHWEGSIEVPGQPLVVQVDLEQTDGAWAGTIDIPGQAQTTLRSRACR